MAGWHLAQFNIARLAHELDDPRMEGFVAALEPVNRLADGAPGFVWRHSTDEGDSTAVRMFDDQRIIVNFSVWVSIEALQDFTYRNADHRNLLRDRRRWFVPLAGTPILVLWWVPAGAIPSLDAARRRLEHLETNGPTPHAFTFRCRFPPPGVSP